MDRERIWWMVMPFVFVVLLSFNPVNAGPVLYTYTSEGSLLTFDADTLEQLSGIAPTSHGGSMDLAFDVTGRLFGEFQNGGGGAHIVEYDPVTLSILNQTSFSPGIVGLAVSIPLLVSAWMGLALLGGVGVVRAVRRRMYGAS